MKKQAGMVHIRRNKISGAIAISLLSLVATAFAAGSAAQGSAPVVVPSTQAPSYDRTTDDYNRRLTELNRESSKQPAEATAREDRHDYRIGAGDQLDISVLEAPELDRAPRVSESGDISLALAGTIRAEGLTARELETVIEELLRRNYIKEPHVNVQVRDMQSHPVAVFGAVKKPGVFQIRGPKTVVELLSMAEGLDADAGDTVIVERHGSANESAAADGAPPSSATLAINLKKLLATGDARLNAMVYPGDVVKVPRAELVYVVGEVAKPGGFELKSNENVSVLQAIAFAQGLTHTSASAHTRIIRTDAATGKRQEIPIDLSKILAGKIADPMLEPRDIVFVPNSVGRTALLRGLETAISVGSGVAIYRW